jgi:hypothetical protein
MIEEMMKRKKSENRKNLHQRSFLQLNRLTMMDLLLLPFLMLVMEVVEMRESQEMYVVEEGDEEGLKLS